MLNNFFTIRAISAYLNDEISGYNIHGISSQEKNKLLLEVHKEDQIKILEFSAVREFNYLIIKEKFSRAKQNYVNLFHEAYGERILNVTLFNNDRLISLELEDNLNLLFTFFGKSNCFLISDGRTVNSFKERENYLHKSISEIIPLRETNNSDIVNLSNGKTDLIHLGNLYSKEIEHRTNLPKKDIVSAINKEKNDTITAILKELHEPKFLLYHDDREVFISLIKLSHKKYLNVSEYKNINDLISEYLKLKWRTEKVRDVRSTVTDSINQRIKNLDKKISSFQTQIYFAEKSDNFKNIGNHILENLHRIKKGDSKFIYIGDEGKELYFKLNENLSPAENAQHYFERYKKQKGSVKILESKLQQLVKEKSELESRLKLINTTNEYKTLVREEKNITDAKKDETTGFRKFKLENNLEVWVGKNSESNDLLTTKYSSPNDLWFHVRGASGSHTVLKISSKRESIGKEVIMKAASIAAYYSKARNASSVPVAYCEKKYVKKKKGFKAGSVVMEREKVVFVKPSLPE